MTPERWRQIEEVFQNAADLESPARFAYLDEACAGDPDLRAEVASLLESEGILHVAPALEQAAQLVAGIGPLEGQRLGVYQILTSIGEGGMGTVYKAARVDGQFEQEVAIKIIRPGAAGAMQSRRFVEERKMLAQLQHPFIGRLIDGGEHAGIPYLVMELIDGIRIDEYCRQWNLGVRERLELFMQVCEAVQHAHGALIVHRDLKPSNILVTGEGVPKLLDFGIATLVQDEKESQKTVWMMMTPDYASPEQVTGGPITVASDVYSLGIVLYELLTGERPYKFKSYAPADIQQVVSTTQIPAPSSLVLRETRLRRQLKGDLDNILLMALRKEPERRYGSVAQFAEDVRRHLAGEMVIARPDTFTYRWSKYIRRNKLSLALASSLVVALLGGAVLTAREGIRAQRRFDEVRSLAGSLLNDIDPEAAKLVGSAKMRRLLVEQSLNYLDRLSNEAGDDIPLQKEVARAYHRVGEIQGHGRSENLGLFNESLASHRKGLAIEEPLIRRFPQDPELKRSLAMGYARIGDLHSRRGDSKNAEDYSHRAYELAERSDPNTCIDVRMSINRARLMEGRFDEALRVGDEALEVAKGIANPTRLIIASIYVGDSAMFKGDLYLHRHYLGIGFRAIDELIKQGELTSDQETRLATLLYDRGEMLSTPDQPNEMKPCEAIPDLDRASKIYARMLRNAGRSPNLLVLATTSLDMLSAAQALCGKKEAIDTAQKAVEVYGPGNIQSNPNLELNLGIAELYVGTIDKARSHFSAIAESEISASEYLADIAVKQRRTAEAIRIYQQARARRKPVLDTPSYFINVERYRQAANLVHAIESGDQTPGLKAQALELLKIFPTANPPASVEQLRRKLR